jgi:hypothetical protein
MMGHREPLKSGDEWDATSRRARKFLSFRPGERAAVKRQLAKRARKMARREVRA